MTTEMLVGIMALIAACAMPPGEYFAINMKGEPAAVVKQVNSLGFPDPRPGFLSAAADFHTKVVSAGTPAQIQAWQHQILNNQVNAFVTGTFLLLVITIVAACGREWWRLLAAKKTRPLCEKPYVALPAG